MVIYGLLTAPTVLATKTDLCATCNVAGPHAIIRRSRWIEIFFIPIAPIWLNHRLVCGNCGAETKLGFRQVRRALREGKLPLPPRANYKAYADALWDAGERRPAESEFDPIEKNPKPGGWNTFLKAWPVIAVIALAGLVILPGLFAKPATPPPRSAHDCWLADGFVAGCRMFDGTIEGVAEGSPTVCYFIEPMPTAEDYQFTCRD